MAHHEPQSPQIIMAVFTVGVLFANIACFAGACDIGAPCLVPSSHRLYALPRLHAQQWLETWAAAQVLRQLQNAALYMPS